MLDKNRNTFLPLKSTSIFAEGLNSHALEQELLNHLLELSRQEPTDSQLKTHLMFLVNQHHLLKNKTIVLWHVDTQNKLSIIAAQHLNEHFKEQLASRVHYEAGSWCFLQINVANMPAANGLIQTDIYLERTKQSLLGFSIWFETDDLSYQLHTPFFKDFFSLVNFILIKALYKCSLSKDFERQRIDYEALLQHQASYDSLTNLPNRFHGALQLEQGIERAEKQKRQLAILFLDLDEFKQINDSMGHTVGDLLLKILAKRYLALMRPSDSLVRLGGDEFMVILEEFEESDYPERFAQQCQEHCLRPFKLEDEEFFITASIGIALYPEHGKDAKTLMCHADAAMYHSKMRGKNNCSVFIEHMMEVTSHRMRIKTELYQVINRKDLQLYYQPIIKIANQKVFSVEALLRWHSRTLGTIAAEELISIAEETGLMVPLGYWVLSQVCADINEWRKASPLGIKVAVNISILQLKQENFIEQVGAILKETGVPAHSLVFEITESFFINDPLLVLNRLNSLNQMGIECSLDDFGMGYSSLNYLRSYPFASLKIDRTFIQGIDNNANDLSLVNTMVNMAKNLNLVVIAEGIENKRQLDLLAKMDCELAQGWYFAKALSAQELLPYLNKNK